MNIDYDVVIIGGGAAGVGAARQLAASAHSTLLLEATSRLGGRAWTYQIAGHPLDLGCGWLHSGDRNSWTRIAEEAGLPVDRRPAKWGVQHRHLGFSPREQKEAGEAFGAWFERLSVAPPASDRASDALPSAGEWNGYLEAISGFISGAPLDRVSVADYLAYDSASTKVNWRAPHGYGDLIVASVPSRTALRLSAPVEAIALEPQGVAIRTRSGDVHAKTAILTVSTAVLAGGAIKPPKALDPWLEAASVLPLGRNEKLYLEVVGESPFAAETHVLGDPRDPRTAAYSIRPFSRPVIECFFGAEGAEMIGDRGLAAGFDYAIGQLAALFGAEARRSVRPLIASSWGRATHIRGAYSYALPGRATARLELARPFEDRLFFAGEATSVKDFSTAHGAHDSGVRAANEALAALQRRSDRDSGVRRSGAASRTATSESRPKRRSPPAT